jgi:hypothetical protein
MAVAPFRGPHFSLPLIDGLQAWRPVKFPSYFRTPKKRARFKIDHQRMFIAHIDSSFGMV